VVEIVKTLLRFNANESCGKCTPCREGTPRLLAMIDQLGGVAGEEELSEVRGLGGGIQVAAVWGLGEAAPLRRVRGVETFPEAFRDRR